jgi:hypothetical protein
MRQKLWVLNAGMVIILLAGFFYPKDVGGPLCGPECLSFGLHSYSQPCLGIRTRRMFVDGYSDLCYGLPLGKHTCYGVPYTEGTDMKDRELDCGYPCNDDVIKVMCQTQGNISLRGFTIPCLPFEARCGW